MRTRKDPIDGIRIATPCPASWEAMPGDDRTRHCMACDLNVYNFAAMTREEVRELLVRTEGRVCARLYRRADGTVLTRDCPSGLRALRQRTSRMAQAMMAALLSLAALASGCTTAGKLRAPRHRSKVALEIEKSAAAQQAAFAGVVVVDQGGTPLPGVEVVIHGETSGRELTAVTDADGAFHFGGLEEGLYRVEVTLSGFASALRSSIPLKHGEIARARVELRFDPIEMVTVGAIAVDPTAMDNGISTTFSQDFIDKLPM